MSIEIILKIPKVRAAPLRCEWFVFLDGQFEKYSTQWIEAINMDRVEALGESEIDRYARLAGVEAFGKNRERSLFYRDKEPDWLIEEYLLNLGTRAPSDY